MTCEVEVSDVSPVVGTDRVKRGMAEMLKGGVIMDVVNAEQAKIAEDAGAVAVGRGAAGEHQGVSPRCRAESRPEQSFG